jgi:hypothetical protein
VFFAEDYKTLLEDRAYVKILESLFLRSTVVFLGYGIKDEYVVNLLLANLGARHLFGDGPHFVVQSSELPTLPETVKAIRYIPEPHSDHRSAIAVLDVIRCVQTGDHVWFAPAHEVPTNMPTRSSSYFITELTPPGTWASSQTLTFGGVDHIAIVGQGFTETELIEKTSPAFHDLTAGLISFDTIYLPLSNLAKLHGMLGPDLLWTLVRSNVLHFIHFQSEPAVIFPSLDSPNRLAQRSGFRRSISRRCRGRARFCG